MSLQSQNFQLVGTIRDVINVSRLVFRETPQLWTGKGKMKGFDVCPGFQGYVLAHQPGTKIKIVRLNSATHDDLNSRQSHPLVHGIGLRSNADAWTIILPNEASYCWHRFAICKELCHVLTDTKPELMCEEVLEQLESASFRPDLNDPDRKLSTEEYCFRLAFELMIPWHSRRDSPDISPEDYMTPEAIVQHAVRTDYFEFSNQLHLQVQSSNAFEQR